MGQDDKEKGGFCLQSKGLIVCLLKKQQQQSWRIISARLGG